MPVRRSRNLESHTYDSAIMPTAGRRLAGDQQRALLVTMTGDRSRRPPSNDATCWEIVDARRSPPRELICHLPRCIRKDHIPARGVRFGAPSGRLR